MVLNNGPPWPSKKLMAPGRRRLGAALGSPLNPANYLHDMEKHWSKSFKLEE